MRIIQISLEFISGCRDHILCIMFCSFDVILRLGMLSGRSYYIELYLIRKQELSAICSLLLVRELLLLFFQVLGPKHEDHERQ